MDALMVPSEKEISQMGTLSYESSLVSARAVVLVGIARMAY
ncbi:hypothetical protein [uncultured Cyclobacterium sp.]